MQARDAGDATHSKRPKLTQAEVERVGELRGRNWSYQAIAREMSCSYGSISWCCLVNGFEPKKPPRQLSANPFPKTYRRNGALCRNFSAEEDAILRELDLKGLTYSEIGRAIGRRHNSVKGRLATLTRYDEHRERALGVRP